MKYDRTVIAYHGCDEEVADRILRGEPIKKSENDYDWLGKGIYFWEYGAARAMSFAEEQRKRSKVKVPTVIGALIQLGNCFDLMDTKYTEELQIAFEMLKRTGRPLPTNGGSAPDKKLRRLDCAVMNFYLQALEEAEEPVRFDTVRCGFVEGEPAFEGSGIHHQSHIQVAVRNPACILGVFRPTIGA